MKKYIKNNKILLEEYNKVYSSRKNKVGKEKARISANQKCMSLVAKKLRSSLSEEYILKFWDKKKNLIREEKAEERFYEYKGNKVVFSKDMKDIKKIKTSKKGKIKDIDDDFTSTLILKIEEKNDLKLSPDMFYAIF